MILKNNLYNKMATMIALAIFLSSFSSAFGVTSPVWQGNPLRISPGETQTINLGLQNMGSNENVSVRAVLTKGSEIATSEAKIYLVKANTKDTEVPIVVSVPLNTPINTTYKVTVSFETVTSGSGGGVVIGTAMDTTFDVLVVAPTPKESVSTKEIKPFNYKIFLILGAILLVIILWLLIKRKKKSLK